ncbi:hypothetical protein C9374_012451 [Naegleria lovaniensis]|uniref:Uncharacterized protein n=1 Tax=Naegleria lovaniensis TaxID=51637 RepID=A0AA88KQX5_NAELO|nr:uncharacterized protein C9374_012451 [Naegleria lovaniensis]KAG2392199.1 hypothetical protein C9374_012451 [Naegleria lovaniensis]
MPSQSSSSSKKESGAVMPSQSSSTTTTTVNKRAALKDRLFQHIEKFFHLHPHQIDSKLITELSQLLRSENVGKEDVLHFFLSLFELCMREESIQKTTSLVVGLKKKSEHGILSVLDSTLISTLCTTLLASVVTSYVQQEINLFSPEELYKLLKQKQQQSSSDVFEQQVKVRLVFITGCFLSGAVFCCHQQQGKKDHKSRPFHLRLIEDVQQDYRRLLKKLKAVSEKKERHENEQQMNTSESQSTEEEAQQHQLAILNVLLVEAFGVILSCMKQQSQKKNSVVSKKDLETFAFELETSFLPEIVDNTPSLNDDETNGNDASERKKKTLKDRTVVMDGAFIRNMLQSTYTELSQYMLHHYIQQYCPTAINERNMIMTGGNSANSENEAMNENSILMTRSFVIALCNYMADFRHLPVQCVMTQFLTNLIVPTLAFGMKKKKKQAIDTSMESDRFLLAKELLESFFTQLFTQMQVPPSPLQQPKSGSANDIIAQLSTRKGYWWEVQVFQDVVECLNNADKNVMNYILDEILPLGEMENSVNPFLLMWGACLNECKQFLKNVPSLTPASPTGNNTLLNSLLMLVVKKQEQKKRKRAESGEENINLETESIKNELKMKQVRETFFNYQLWLGSCLRPRILSLTSANPSLSKFLLSRESVLCKVSNTLGRYTTDNGKLSSFTMEADKKKKRNMEDDEDEFTSSSRKTSRSLIRTLSSWLRDAIKLRVGTITRSILMILEQYDEQMERFIAKKNQMDLVQDSLAQEEEKEEEWLNEEALQFLLSCFPTNVRVYDKSEDSFTADDLVVLLKKLFEVGAMMNYENDKLLSSKKKDGLAERDILIRQKSYYGKDIIDMSSNLVKVILNNLAVQEFNWMRHQFHPSSKESNNEKAQLTGSKSWSGEIYDYAVTLFGLEREKKSKQETRKRIFDTADNNVTLSKIRNLLSKIQKELEKISIGSSSKTCMDWTILSALAIYLKQLVISSMFDPWVIESEEQGKPMVEDLLRVYESLSSLSSEELVALCQKKGEDSMQDEDTTQPTEVLTDLLVVNINAEPNLTLASRIVFMTLAKYLNEECLDLLFNYLMNDGEVDEIDEEDESDEEEDEESDDEEEEKADENNEEEQTQNGENSTSQDAEGTAIIRNDEDDEEGGIDLNNPSDVSRVLELLKARNEAKRRKSEEKQQKLKRMEFAMNIVQVLEGLCIKSVPQPVLVLLLFKGTQYVLDKLWYQNNEDVVDHLKKATGYAVNTIFNKVFQLVMILTKEYRQQLLSDASTSPCAIVFDKDAKEALFETARIYAIEFSKYGKYLSSIQGKAKRAVLAKSLAPTLNMEQCAHMLSIYIRLMYLLRTGSNKVMESTELDADIEKILFGSEKSMTDEEDNLGTSMELLISLAQSDASIACALSSKIITFALEKIIYSGDKKYRNKKSGLILAQPHQREMYDRILVHLVKPYLATLLDNKSSQANTVLLMILDAYVKDICPAMKVNRTVKPKALKKCASVLLSVLEYLSNHSTKQDDFTDAQMKELIICFYFVFYHAEKKEKKSEEKSVWSQALPLFEAWRKRWNLLSDVEFIQQNLIESTQDLDKTAIELLKQRRETFKNERKERVKQELLKQQQEEDNKKKRKRNEKAFSSTSGESKQDEAVTETKTNKKEKVVPEQKESSHESSTKKRKTTPTAFAFNSDEAPAETIEEMKKKSGVIPPTSKNANTMQTSKKPQKSEKTASFMKETASSAAKKAAIAESKKPQPSSKKIKK